MLNSKDYHKLTLEELLREEKKTKKSETISRFIMGFFVGVMLYGIAKNGFGFLYIFIPLILIGVAYKYSQNLKQNLKQIKVEISAKSTS